MHNVIVWAINTFHILKSILCLVTQTGRLILSYMHIHQFAHNYKSAQHKDLKQRRTVKEDCDLTCSAAGGGGKAAYL